jgi:RNA polymerase sigma factor (sigma-70 family)
LNTYTTEHQNMASLHVIEAPSNQSATNNPQSAIRNPQSAIRNPQSTTRRAALKAIYDAHVEQIYKFVFFKVGNREDAEDITSQVFIKAAHSLDVTQQGHTQLAWLYQVARTTVTDHWRNYYRGVTSSLDALEEESPLHLAAEPLYAEAPQEDTVDPSIEKVRAVLALLPQNYRRVLELRFLQGCSQRETAAAMQITEANAKVIQHRAIQKALKVGAGIV